jgi:signal transduction histidine kinase
VIGSVGWLMLLAVVVAWASTAIRGRRRTERVARALHDVRGPLTALAMAVHAADLPPGPGRTTARRAALAAAERQVRRADAALEEATAALSGRLPVVRSERVEVDGLLRSEVVAWGPVAQAVGVSLSVGSVAPSAVHGDGARLARLTSNLIANALEHGDGDVRIGAHADDARVRIEVRDGGTGPAPAPRAPTAPRIRRRVPGRGLGLGIAADIAARHGGRLVVGRSGPRGGVAVELPRADRPRPGGPR